MSYNLLLDDVIRDLGGCGLFQGIVVAIVHSVRCCMSWSMLTMMFAGQDPGFWCTPDKNVTIQDGVFNTSGQNPCTACSSYSYGEGMNTLVSEYDLVCDRKWMIATITTCQMGGVLVGCFVGGHLGDWIGRKPTFFLAVVTLMVSNIAAIFSPSWVVYAVMRAVIGVGIGFFITIQYNVMLELVLASWRPRIVAVPAWAIHATMFAGLAWLLHDWKHIHIATAAIGLPFLLTWWIVPESFRWLVTKQRYVAAETVIRRVAKVNRRRIPDLTRVIAMAEDEYKQEKEKQHYTIIDVFRFKFKATLALLFIWMSMSYSYYSIMFGIQNLSGNLYLNMFLSSVVEIPASLMMMFFVNRFGRRNTCIVSFMLAGICGLVVGALQHVDTPLQGQLINGFAYGARFSMSVAWGAMTVLTQEVYPTVVRTIAYGMHNTSARIGGMLAPQIVYLNDSLPGLLFFLIGGTMVTSSLLFLIFPETKDRALEDTLASKNQRRADDLEDKQDLAQKTV